MKTYRGKWYEFTPDWSGFHLAYEVAGYYDNRAVLQIYFIWGKLFLFLPWKHYKKVERKKTIKEIRNDKIKKLQDKNYKIKKVYQRELYDECDAPKYGIYYYHKSLGLELGYKIKILTMPWYPEWIRTSALCKDNKTWIHETKGACKEFWNKKIWDDILYCETYPYQYITKSGAIQNCLATIRVEEREWRWHSFKWLKWTRHVQKEIQVDFNDDIGERKGTWKGGTTGCAYSMLPNETPYETLKRMESNRRFD